MFFFLLLALVIILAAFAIGGYNSLIQIRNQVRNAWKQIDIQLKRRHDLIPNLVNAVKGQMEFEKGTLERVIQARAAAVGAHSIPDSMAKEDVLSSALSKLLAVVENYPTLKANESVGPLMEELTTTENQISFARQFYNDITTKYNTKLEIFPTNLFASSFGFKMFPLFTIKDAGERETPTVDLSLKN
ncbi:MAG: LemA family protein [Ignavibacteriae bacterium]|nr:MAG: LemA family protein [Ignavibacteriota bacterium]